MVHDGPLPSPRERGDGQADDREDGQHAGGQPAGLEDDDLALPQQPVVEEHLGHLGGFPGTIQPRDNFGPMTVPKDAVFTMGDNRDQSYDSRFWGVVDLKDVLGKAFIMYWSWNREDHNVRWSRLGRLVR